MNKKWFRNVPVMDAQSARVWMHDLTSEDVANYNNEIVDYVWRMSEDAIGSYDKTLHNILGEVFDVGCPIPRDEEFFIEISRAINFWHNCMYDESSHWNGYIATILNRLYGILQGYIDDWNLNGCDRCPLDM